MTLGDALDEKGGEVATKETAETDRPVLQDAGVKEETGQEKKEDQS